MNEIEINTIYTIRNDVVSSDEKLMTEKACTYLEETFHWKRKLISREKFKRIYKHTTPKGKTIFTYIAMRNTQYHNVFINIDIYNEYKDSDTDLFIVMTDKRNEISPRWIWMSEIKGKDLKHAYGTTEGVLIPEVWFHEFDKIKSV